MKGFTMEDNAGDDIIDSRDIIARYEDLKDELESFVEAVTEAQTELDDYISITGHTEIEADDNVLFNLKEELDATKSDLAMFNTIQGIELEELERVIEEGESSPDWRYGEGLIKDEYFTEYTEQLIADTCELPKEFKSNDWPWRHMEINYEDAAEELKSDYFEIEIGDYTYWIRA